ncbi:NADH dehydrogenase [ubiquinone] 1 beta subcomplex subunit 8, mitochondrial [Echinococcus granulosus]|uniref:NADH dehydrogenase [ubiquinone] 1 beta subcomplex subunit n=1 Tax=Echinococcus granulosus TaxID=6210 RepID=U6JNH2_ECHGR|nr:NADH dehydrogenase [ubiquinone] 1 beta subcomplex subunit [Echinococcus granulosus]EUB58866.1 NADH dehydrogenase [ubiquinone] 1 beta subcomplex subunit [Echinococcus granulosus]KAH9278392.1 NADH dehydrogenase [ubiquinone] 1 beta subcomplex subunit 8, mitochondrial [Echinococcus granulosus]CDS23351.1 NADH dehydrogenase ubiquinone 1 beta [Echinococcus granulosus]
MVLICRGPGLLRFSLPLVSQKNFAYWHADWKPKPFPTTPAQREAAAKKYGLLPEDYETYEPDGNCPGDYPKLEPFNELHRDPYEHYDYGHLKRNYNEPIPWFWDFYGPMGYDNYQQQLRYNEPRWRTLIRFIAPVFILFPLFYLGDMYKLFRPMMPKQYPSNGRDNYTFEPADE